MTDSKSTPCRCPLCSSSQISAWHSKQGCTLYHCNECTLGFRHPMPRIEELKTLYSETLFASPGRRQYYIEDTGTAAANAIKSLDLLRKYHPWTGQLLDAGCAFGHFLALARDHAGFEVKGCEISDFAAQHARETYNLDVEQCSIDEFSSDIPFDVITLWDVIEHLIEPEKILIHLRRLLKPDGIILISTGDCNSMTAKMLGKRWPIINPLQHLYYFNPASIDRLLRKTGFRRVGLDRSTRLYNLHYLAMKIRENLKILSPAALLIEKMFSPKSNLSINLRDIMVVAARLN